MATSRLPQANDEHPDDLVTLLQRVVVDIAVLAPIGFVKRARTLIPELIEEGRSTVASAQTIGRFVTPILRKQGTKLVSERVATVRPKRSKAPAGKTPTVPTAAAPSPALSGGGEHGPEPFVGYDHLGSAAVVARLGEFTAAQRRVIRTYEASHRNRRTVLGRLDQLDAR